MVKNKDRLAFHLQEAYIHIDRLQNVLKTLKEFYPFSVDVFENLSAEMKDKLDVLAFRFAKLQDLLGTKIFREYLVFLQYPVEDKNFLDLLKELEKEDVVDIDVWSEFRGVRNSISHDYPFEEDEKVEAINYLVKNIDYLMDVTKKIKDSYEAVEKRD